MQQFLTSVLTRWRLWRLSSKFNLHSKRKKTNPPTWGTCTCPIFKPNNSPCWQYLSLISLKPLWKTLYMYFQLLLKALCQTRGHCSLLYICCAFVLRLLCVRPTFAVRSSRVCCAFVVRSLCVCRASCGISGVKLVSKTMPPIVISFILSCWVHV